MNYIKRPQIFWGLLLSLVSWCTTSGQSVFLDSLRVERDTLRFQLWFSSAEPMYLAEMDLTVYLDNRQANGLEEVIQVVPGKLWAPSGKEVNLAWSCRKLRSEQEFTAIRFNMISRRPQSGGQFQNMAPGCMGVPVLLGEFALVGLSLERAEQLMWRWPEHGDKYQNVCIELESEAPYNGHRITLECD